MSTTVRLDPSAAASRYRIVVGDGRWGADDRRWLLVGLVMLVDASGPFEIESSIHPGETIQGYIDRKVWRATVGQESRDFDTLADVRGWANEQFNVAPAGQQMALL
jgi:hypothetical protein